MAGMMEDDNEHHNDGDQPITEQDSEHLDQLKELFANLTSREEAEHALLALYGDNLRIR
jgi:hypothetical protein